MIIRFRKGVKYNVCSRGGPRGGLGGYHSSPSAWVPKLASTLEVPPHLPGLGRRGGGPSPSARAVWADWLEWMGRKTAQAVRNRISSVLASLGTQAEGEGDSHFRLVLGLPYTITINIPWSAPCSSPSRSQSRKLQVLLSAFSYPPPLEVRTSYKYRPKGKDH